MDLFTDSTSVRTAESKERQRGLAEAHDALPREKKKRAVRFIGTLQ
jgi:hypothetical protein